MKAIIAKNNLSFVGKDGELPWKCKEDLKLFRELTRGSRCVVGFNTYQKLPKLKDREIILDSRDGFAEAEWCIGGSKTYEKYCHLFTELHISLIDNNTIGDVIFPNLENLNKECKIIIHRFKEN